MKIPIQLVFIFGLQKFCEFFSSEDSELFATLCDEIWNNQNLVLFDGKHREPLSMVRFVTNSLVAFKEANVEPLGSSCGVVYDESI